MPSPSAQHIFAERRVSLAVALLLSCLLAMIWGEGIAIADQVNSTATTVAPDSHAEGIAPPGEPVHVDEPPSAEAREQTMPNMSAFELVVAAIGVVALWIFFASRWHRLERVPRRPSFLTPLMGFIIVVLLLVGGGIGLSTARWMFSIGEEIEDESHPVRATAIIIAGAHVAQFIVLTLLVWLWSQSRRPIHETRPSHRAAAMLGIGAFILAWPIVLLVSLVVNVIIMIVTGEPVEPIAHDTLLLFREHEFDGWMILLIVLVALSAPLIEEVMYRGVVQESLRQLGLSRWTAIVLTSVFFAAMHWPVIEPHAVATLFVVSLGFGWVYERSGRLAAPVAMHAAFNVGNLTLVMMMH